MMEVICSSYRCISVLMVLELEFTPRPGWEYNLSRSLEGLSCLESSPLVVLHAADFDSFCELVQQQSAFYLVAYCWQCPFGLPFRNRKAMSASPYSFN